MKLKDLTSFDVDILQEMEMGVVKGGWRRETTNEREEKNIPFFIMKRRLSFLNTSNKKNYN